MNSCRRAQPDCQTLPNKGYMELPDIELVSAKVHEAWMENKKRNGIITRKLETGEELMVPYARLSEQAKELDRGSVRAVYDAIIALQPPQASVS